MRAIPVLAAALLLLLPSWSAAEPSNPWERQLPFEQARIHYQVSGMEHGTETLYIRDHGSVTARYRETEASMFGMAVTNRTVQIVTPDWVYDFDLEEGSGTRSINPQKLMLEEYQGLPPADQDMVRRNAEKMGTTILAGLDGALEPEAREILGYLCDRMTAMGSTIYSIHQTPIPLYSDTNIMGVRIKSIATEIDLDPVPDRFFAFPEGIEPQPDLDSDQMSRIMAEQTMAALLDPEASRAGRRSLPGAMPDAGDWGAAEGEEASAEQPVVEETMKMLRGLFEN